MQNMKTGQAGLNLIKRFEGLSLKPYADAVGVPTIGYGNTYYENGGKVRLTDPPIDEARAEALLRHTLRHYEQAVNAAVAVPLTQNQFDALVSFTYNLGAGNLQRSTLLKKLNAGDYQGAAAQFARWNRAGGRVLRGLTRRREAERRLFLEDGT